VAVLAYDTAFDKHLRPGEQLRWVGRARRDWVYRWSNRIVFVQIAAAVFALIWIARLAYWSLSALGMNAGPHLGPPTFMSSVIVFTFAAVTAWQMVSERRRRAGTWYAVTGQRVLFVLTSATPQSVIGVEFSQIAKIYFNTGLEIPGPPNGIILKLKQVDPYLCNSRVLGYQLGKAIIFLEDVEDPQEFYKHLMARGRVNTAT
jgi:hypothetical protein